MGKQSLIEQLQFAVVPPDRANAIELIILHPDLPKKMP